MSNLVEQVFFFSLDDLGKLFFFFVGSEHDLLSQIRAPLSSIRTLSKMLSAQVNSNEVG